MILKYSEDADDVLTKTYQIKMEQMKSLPIMKANAEAFLWATQMQYEDAIVALTDARDQMSTKLKAKRKAWRTAYFQAEADFLAKNQRKDMKVNSLKRTADRVVEVLDDEVEDLLASIKTGEDLRDAIQERIRSIKVIARIEHRDL